MGLSICILAALGTAVSAWKYGSEHTARPRLCCRAAFTVRSNRARGQVHPPSRRLRAGGVEKV